MLEDGTELYGEEVIQSAYKDEFAHRLRQREIVPELTNYERRTKELCNLYVEEAARVKGNRYTDKEIDEVLKKVKRGKCGGRDCLPPEIFIDCGVKLKMLVAHTLEKIRTFNTIPKQWTEVLISTIFKNKGSKKVLVNYRGIFLKLILSKIFERVNMNRIKDKVENIDKFQAGARTNRGPADQTYLLRGSLDHSKYMGKATYVTLYDFAQCFDSLWLEDCLICLWHIGVQDEVLSIIRNMNQTSNIIVKTPVGLTDEFVAENTVQQGSVLGGLLCTASTAEINNDIKTGGVQIGTSNIRTLIFVDDIAAVNHTLEDAYSSHDIVEKFSKKKRLAVSTPKCMVMCVNGGKNEVTPRLKIDGVLIPVVECATYLGDQFNKVGNNKDLIEERVKKGKACLVNAMSLCSDVTMGLYSLQTMLLLYRSLFLQVVLNNASAWSNLSKQDLTALRTIQLKYLKRMFHAPSSTPNTLIFLELGVLPIEQEIHIKQLTFLYHILTLGSNDPVKQLYRQQLRYDHAPNWANEVKALRDRYGIRETDAEIQRLTKGRWKNIVRTSVATHTLQTLNNEKNLLKHGSLLPPYVELKCQEYVSKLVSSQARKLFHVRVGVIDIKERRRYKYGDDNLCRLCTDGIESINHVINECTEISRTRTIDDAFSTNEEDTRDIAARFVEFSVKVDQ